jgi:hypothetical protein
MKIFTLVFILLTLSFISCKKDEVTAKQPAAAVTAATQIMVTGVNGPTQGLVDQQLLFTLVWPNNNTPHYFDSLAVNPIQTHTQHIKLFVTKDSLKSNAAPRSTAAVYKFKASSPGTYYLKFAKPSNDSSYSIIDTIVIK